MHNINFIRENPIKFDNAMKQRGEQSFSKKILEIDKQKRNTQTLLQNLLAERNSLSKEIGKLKSNNKDVSQELIKVSNLKKEISNLKELEIVKDDELHSILSRLPNIPHSTTPTGLNEKDNVLYKEWGIKPDFLFKPKKHFEIGENLNLMNFDIASKLSGSRFVILKSQLSRLERAISNFMLDKHTNDNGYTEINVPFLVKDDALFGTGQLPKFSDDLFTAGENHWLIPTAEVPLTNLVREQILDENALPMRFTSYTPCFRSEAGAAGKDTKGMLRQHQFTKVELVSITKNDQSDLELERMLKCAEGILQDLNIHYRVVLLSTGDMGFAAKKTYDIEVWIPSQNTYREISSCSNFEDFQSRRANIRFRQSSQRKTRFAHTLNGSGLAIGRTWVAIVENFQQEDGSFLIPEPLRGYMGGLESVSPRNRDLLKIT